MPFTKINFQPGLYNDGTSYANEGKWYSCDKIRFRSGFPEKIGGWLPFSASAFLGTCTALFNWVLLAGTNLMAVGTNLKYYLVAGGTYNDITPIRASSTINNNPFATANTTYTVTVTDTAHGAAVGDFVTFSGATGPVGGISAATLNSEYQIQTVVDANTYTITSPTVATSTTSGGGNAVVAAYQISVGLAVAVAGTGWGSGTWGRGTWGSAAANNTITNQLRVWTQDNFGQDLVFADRGGGIYHWLASGGTGTRAVFAKDESSASDVPTIVSGIIVTDERHVVAYGANAIGSGTQDPLFIRWSDTESVINWTPSVTNTAGGYRLSSGSTIMAALKMKQEVLFWTDSDVYSMQFIGGQLVYGFQFLDHNTSIAGPMAAISANNVVYWMGKDKFYMYNGRVSTLDCPVWQYVFDDINLQQSFQFHAGTNEGFNEVIWFYCSSGSTMVDRYVIYNHIDSIWYYGTLARSAWLDTPLQDGPIAAGGQYLYQHETGIDDGSTNPPSAISAYIESSDFDLGDGDHFQFVKTIIPDVNFTGSTASAPSVVLTMKARNQPGNTWSQTLPSTVTQTATTPVSQYTELCWIRLRGRQATFKVASSDIGVQWQLGATRVEIQPDGKR